MSEKKERWIFRWGRYEQNCKANDELCNGFFRGHIRSLSKEKPDTTYFADIDEATWFVFQLPKLSLLAFLVNQGLLAGASPGWPK